MKISFIGAGNMAGAIINSLITSGRANAYDITIFDVNKDKYESFKKLGVNTAIEQKDAVVASYFILLAVKPQDYESVLLKIKAENKVLDGKVFISIAAGISTGYITKTLEKNLGVIRVMPNTPLLIGCGATAITRNEFVNDRDYTKICGMFASSGVVSTLPEEQMNAVIGVNSSSPAYIYLFAKAMLDGAEEQGIKREDASRLVFEMIRGSALMLLNSGKSPEELIKMVASPKGTTLAALESFEKNNFSQIVKDAMLACTNRAEEIKR